MWIAAFVLDVVRVPLSRKGARLGAAHDATHGSMGRHFHGILILLLSKLLISLGLGHFGVNVIELDAAASALCNVGSDDARACTDVI